MKTLWLVFSCCSVVALGNAQKKNIPPSVTDAFSERYPHATHVEWTDKVPYYQASFVLNGASISANFSSEGEWEYSERSVNYEALPQEVKDALKKCKYSDWQKGSISEVQELGKPLQYRINVQKPGQRKNVYFDANGKILKETPALY